MYSDDYEYANSRLAETIVRKGEEPIFVHKVSRGMQVTYHSLSDKEGEEKVCKIEELNLKPVSLGYCNFNKQVVYLSRLPMRRDWRQGLRRGNFVGIGEVDINRLGYDAIGKTIEGVYPSFEKCVSLLGKVRAIAWSRNWALRHDGVVMYKGDKAVGNLVEGKIVLDTRFHYLSQALEEVM